MKIIAVTNQKGGVGKTTTVQSFGVALARNGKRVLLIDMDPQGSLTASFGYQNPDELNNTLTELLHSSLNDNLPPKGVGIIHTSEGVDLIPGNIELAGLESTLVNVMSRERVLINYINNQGFYSNYDYILIDCMPSLGMLTINALTAADTVLIPIQANFLSLKGTEQLIRTIWKVKKNLNSRITIEGLLITMCDERTNNARGIEQLIRREYGNDIDVFNAKIPKSVRAEEAPAMGKSIYGYAPSGRVAWAYDEFTEEFLSKEERNDL